MKNKTPMEFKAATVDEAIANGLKEMGLTIDQVDIEKKSYGGIFTKACVIITPKETAAVTAEEIVAEPVSEIVSDPVEPATVPSAAALIDLTATEKECVEFVTQLISKMGVRCEVTSDTENGEVNIYVNGDDAGLIIGYRGEVLDAIQYFALMLANKGEKEFVRVQVDAGNYRKKRKETLAGLARRLAVKTARSGRRTVLEPMNPFERRVIHTTLADDKEVTTQSEGEGKFRHVIIIPNQEERSYGRSDFRRNGPGKTHSFGYNKRRY